VIFVDAKLIIIYQFTKTIYSKLLRLFLVVIKSGIFACNIIRLFNFELFVITMRKTIVFVYILLAVYCSQAWAAYSTDPRIDIIHYDFNLALNDSTNRIEGTAVIRIKYNQALTTFSVDFKNLNSSGEGMNVAYVLFNGKEVKWNHVHDKLSLTLDTPVKQGEVDEVTVEYSGIPADGLLISKNKFGDRSFFSDHWPDRASNYLPVIDHPSDKATVDFIITAPSHYKIVANGYLVEESDLGNGYSLTHWEEDIPLPVKVMAFGATRFAVRLAGFAGNIPVWTWVYMENREEGFNDYSVAVKPVALYSRLIGPYPYEKLANVQSKTTFGGLENASCIFYNENSVTGRGRAENLIAHEIAHQWFGNSVTEKDWYHIWLSEGFATYLASVYIENTYGEEQFRENMISARNRVIRYSSRRSGSVIDTTITNLRGLLSANTYEKGAWVLHMLRNDIGDELFWKGIRLYYERFRNGNALTSDLMEVMEEVSGKNLKDFFNQWLYQKGLPVLRITTAQGKKKGTTDILIEQLQDDLFSFNLEIGLKNESGMQVKTIPVTGREATLNLPYDKVPEIVPDPGTKLLFSLVK
jgi:aminopeptidase N